jgi:hypothetical protein
MNVSPQLPIPIVCCVCGTFFGLVSGGCQAFPAWVGALTGISVGSVISVACCLLPDPQPIPVARAVTAEPVIVQNYYVYHASGAEKEPRKPL